MEPSVAAVLPSSSEAGAESITRAVTGKKQQALQGVFPNGTGKDKQQTAIIIITIKPPFTVHPVADLLFIYLFNKMTE